jgi:hypothetical protein
MQELIVVKGDKTMADGIGGFLGKNCTILFFILVFLILFWDGFGIGPGPY